AAARQRTGVDPKVETNTIGTLFIQWRKVLNGKQTTTQSRVSGRDREADAGGRECEGAQSTAWAGAQYDVPLARCVSAAGRRAERAGRASAPPPRPKRRKQTGAARAHRGAGRQHRTAGGGHRFFQRSLQASQRVAESPAAWRESVYAEVRRMTLREDSSLAVDRACRLAGVSRAGYYRVWMEHEPRAAETAVRGRI